MKLSNAALHEKLLALAGSEREVTLQVLHHLREAEARKLFAHYGYSSLFEYAVAEMKYSEGSAQRRISAMRLLKELPDLEQKMETGEIKFTQLSQIQTFLRTEAKAGQSYTAEAKRDLVLATIGKSTREVALELSPEKSESISVDPKALTLLKEVRDRFAHELPHGANFSDVIEFLAKRALKTDPMKKPIKAVNSPPALAAESHPSNQSVQFADPLSKGDSLSLASQTSHQPQTRTFENTRFIPMAIKRKVWKDQAQGCAFVSSATGKRCCSRHRLQIDHIHPYSLGGSSRDSGNLRLLCATHNQVTWKARRRPWAKCRNGSTN